MKKLILLLTVFSFTLILSAQEAVTQWILVGVGKATRDGKYVEEKVEEKIEVKKAEEKVEEKIIPSNKVEENNNKAEVSETDNKEPSKSKFRIKNRGFELGIANITLGLSNNFLTLDEIFTEVIVIDLENLDNGLKFDVNAEIRPIYLFINHKDQWGFGLDIGRISVFGNMNLSGNLIRFKKTDEDQFGVGASAFVDVGLPIFFRINALNGFKVNLRPAGYVPAIYLEPNMKYSYKDTNKGSLLALDYDLQLYTIVPIDPENNSMQPDFSVGFDLSAGLEYKLIEQLDLGVDVKNIPIVPGALSHYMKMKGSIAVDTTNLSFDSEDGADDLMDSEIGEMIYGTEKKNILRPFKTILYANYRPFKTELFTIIPRVGFAINPLYAEPWSLEAGGSIRCDLGNLFITTIGVNYTDQMWKNSVDLAINLRVFELDLGMTLQSSDFVKSWTGAGIGASVGLKFGW